MDQITPRGNPNWKPGVSGNAAGRPLTTRQLTDRIYRAPIQHWHYGSVRDAARRFAVEEGRHHVAPGNRLLAD
jgi:hypothetical protein